MSWATLMKMLYEHSEMMKLPEKDKNSSEPVIDGDANLSFLAKLPGIGFSK